MKISMRRLALCTLALLGFLCVGWQAHALPPVYTLTAVFYEDDDELARFTKEGLQYEFRYISGHHVDGFSEKIPNPLKSYGMNTIHQGHSYRKQSMITKLVPIDMRKLKDMPPQEYAQMQDLLGKCMAGVIIFDYANPKLQAFEEYFARGRDLEAYLEYDINFNYAFKLMKSVEWGQFVSVRIYNKSKLDAKYFERQEQGINEYMGDLEEFYCRVDNRWGTREQVETIYAAFATIADSGAGLFGSGRELFEKEPLAKEYMGIDYKDEFVSHVVPSALGAIVQGEETKTQENPLPIVHSGSLDAVIQQDEEIRTQENSLPVVHSGPLDAIIQDEEIKTQENPLPIVHSDSLDAIIQDEEIKTQENSLPIVHSGPLDAIIQDEEIKTQENPLPIVHSGSLDAVIQDEEIKTQEDPSQGMCSAQILMDEIQYWQSRIEQNEVEIARLGEPTGYHAEPKFRDNPTKMDSMNSKELCNCMNQLKKKHQNQNRTIQMLRNIPRAHLPLMQGKKDVKLQIEETSPALLYSGLSDQTVQGEQSKTQGDPLQIVNPNEALAASAYPTENKKTIAAIIGISIATLVAIAVYIKIGKI